MRAAARACVVAARVDGARLAAELHYPSGLEVFAGHFPGRPLVPGVFLLEGAREACARALGRDLALREVVEAKLVGEVLPGDAVELTGSVAAVAVDRTAPEREDPSGVEARVSLRTSRGEAARLRLLLVAGAPRAEQG